METASLIINLVIGACTIIAIWHAPITALKIQKAIEDRKEKQQRKLWIFETLLATRGDKLSLEHVRALNMIDIEFYGEKEIEDTWNLYRDHLNTTLANNDETALRTWSDKSSDYFTDLLYAMSKFFGYNFNKVILKKGAYSPQAHGQLQNELMKIRRGQIDLLEGKTSLNINLTPMPTMQEANNPTNHKDQNISVQ